MPAASSGSSESAARFRFSSSSRLAVVDDREFAAQAPRAFGPEEVMINFPNAPVVAVLPYYEKLTKKRIIRDANLEGNLISICSEKPLTEEEAIRFIDSALLLNGYAMLPVDSSTLKLVNFGGGKSIRSQQLPVISDPSQLPETEQVINYVMKLTHVPADHAIDAFSKLVALNSYGAMTALENSNSLVITESTSMIRMLLNFKQHVDTPKGNLTHHLVKLKQADAERVAELIHGVYKQRSEQKTGALAVGAAPGESSQSASSAQSGPEQTGIAGVSIVPYRRTNSILVVAPPAEYAFIEEMISTFDKPSDCVNFMKRKLTYVSVLDYMPSFYNALARGTDLSHRQTDALQVPDGKTALASMAQFSPGKTPSRDSSGAEGSVLAQSLLSTPEETAAPLSYSIGDTLLIGDPQANSLIVSGSPEHIDIVQKLIDEIDVRPRQVYLSTVIGQLKIGDDFDYAFNALQSLATHTTGSGNQWSGGGSVFSGRDAQPNFQDLTTSNGFSRSFQSLSVYGRYLWGSNNASLDTMVRLLARNTEFQILSRPSVYAQNNVKATIASGQRIAIPTSTLTTAGGLNNGFAGSITSNIEFRDVVLKLEVIPLINSDQEVTLKIAQINDNVVGSQIISGNEIPTLSTQELQTTVTLKNGETMVLGGLITNRENESETSVPGIRRIPLIGKALGSTSRNSTREELLIFIQPHIIDGVSQCINPNSLEKCRNSLTCKGLEFAEPFPPRSPDQAEVQSPDKENSRTVKKWPFRKAAPPETPKMASPAASGVNPDRIKPPAIPSVRASKVEGPSKTPAPPEPWNYR